MRTLIFGILLAATIPAFAQGANFNTGEMQNSAANGYNNLVNTARRNDAYNALNKEYGPVVAYQCIYGPGGCVLPAPVQVVAPADR